MQNEKGVLENSLQAIRDTLRTKGEVILRVTLKPSSKRSCILSVDTWNLTCEVTAQPIENKANKALITLLSKKLSVPKSNIQILSGLHSKNKKIHIAY